MEELTLSEIWIYPIKSLGGIPLTSARVMPKGLQHDRRWMLVKEDLSAITQREYPMMSRFKLALETDKIVVRFNGYMLDILFSHQSYKNPMPLRIWDDTVEGFEVSDSHSQWFSTMLSMPCKLVYFPENNPRPVDPKYTVNNDHVSLADGYPFLIIGQASLDDLNNRLSTPLPMNRFRPNLVFTGGTPHQEDTWRNFSIGNNKFVGVKPCSRCIMTTINQDTAEKGIEPLKTLATYRRRDNKIYFGQNIIAVDHGGIAVGDKIKWN
jgi:uncharacterized protein YcbX